jgi:hypothetical protein
MKGHNVWLKTLHLALMGDTPQLILLFFLFSYFFVYFIFVFVFLCYFSVLFFRNKCV